MNYLRNNTTGATYNFDSMPIPGGMGGGQNALMPDYSAPIDVYGQKGYRIKGDPSGVLLADCELIGIPHRVVIGDRGLKEGMVEYQARRDAAATSVALTDIAAWVQARLSAWDAQARAAGAAVPDAGRPWVGRCPA